MANCQPFAVGLCTAQHPLPQHDYHSHSHPHYSQHCAHDFQSHSATDFDLDAEYQQPVPGGVPIDPFVATVAVRATPAQLSRALCLPERLVYTDILLDTSSPPPPPPPPPSRPAFRHVPARPKRFTSSAAAPVRYTPRSVHDACIALSASSQPPTATKTTSTEAADIEAGRAACLQLSLPPARFLPLFVPPSSAAAAIVRFAELLSQRLSPCSTAPPSASSCSTSTSNSDANSGSSSECGVEPTATCGWDDVASHRHVELSCAARAAYRIRPGPGSLPRLAYSAACTTASAGVTYFEAVCVGGHGSVVKVGVAKKGAPPDRPPVAALETTTGQRVGCIVHADGSGDCAVTFTVEGIVQKVVTVQGAGPLRAAAALHDMTPKVAILCCPGEWKASREDIAHIVGRNAPQVRPLCERPVQGLAASTPADPIRAVIDIYNFDPWHQKQQAARIKLPDLT